MSTLLAACAASGPRYQSPNRQALGAGAPPPGTQTTATATPVERVKLDVGIDVFDAGIDTLDAEQRVTTASVRRAEAHYIPTVLADTLERHGLWGTVRVIPKKQTEMDLWVDGRILESDGTRLALQITATDATGQPWFTREYKGAIDRYAYDPDPTTAYRDPFQKVYEQIADDLERELLRRDPTNLREVRAVTQLQFGQRFAPAQFDGYLVQDPDGRTRVHRLPALNDPLVQRMADLRARDLTFVDSVDHYFDDFAREMQPAYDSWRRESYQEVSQMNRLEASGVARKIGGALAVLGGIAAMALGNDSAIGAAGLAGVAGGAYLFGSGVEKTREAEIHAAALGELADSFGTSMKPHHIELSNRSVTLSGSVEEQYAQWRGLLAELYQAENSGVATTDGLPIITTDSSPTAAP